MLMNRGDFFEGGFLVLLLGDFLVLEMMIMMKVCRKRSIRKSVMLLLAWCVNYLCFLISLVLEFSFFIPLSISVIQ